jgi:hypothetical protein
MCISAFFPTVNVHDDLVGTGYIDQFSLLGVDKALWQLRVKVGHKQVGLVNEVNNVGHKIVVQTAFVLKKTYSIQIGNDNLANRVTTFKNSNQSENGIKSYRNGNCDLLSILVDEAVCAKSDDTVLLLHNVWQDGKYDVARLASAYLQHRHHYIQLLLQQHQMFVWSTININRPLTSTRICMSPLVVRGL